MDVASQWRNLILTSGGRGSESLSHCVFAKTQFYLKGKKGPASVLVALVDVPVEWRVSNVL